jgi:hypothetical protein
MEEPLQECGDSRDRESREVDVQSRSIPLESSHRGIFSWGSSYRNPVESESKSVLTEKPLKGGEELWLGNGFSKLDFQLRVDGKDRPILFTKKRGMVCDGTV